MGGAAAIHLIINKFNHMALIQLHSINHKVQGRDDVAGVFDSNDVRCKNPV